MPAKRILVPTDGSKGALEAASYAAELARSLGADVTLIHVVEVPRVPTAFLAGAGGDGAEEIRQSFLESGKAILALTQRPLAEAGVVVQRELREGWPGEVIVEVAEQGRYDLIVMSNRGTGLADSLILGSVSDQVVRSAPCPVLIVRGDWSGRPD